MDINQKILPYFPLAVFLLPGEEIPMQIYEPRYIQLINECSEEDCTFAIPFLIDDKIQDFGCEVKLQQIITRRSEGEMVITIEGVSLVKIESFLSNMEDKLYAGGKVNLLPESQMVSDIYLIENINNYREHFDREFLVNVNLYAMDVYKVLQAMNLPSEEKFKFVLMNSLSQQEKYLSMQMDYLLLLRNQEKLLGNDFGLN